MHFTTAAAAAVALFTISGSATAMPRLLIPNAGSGGHGSNYCDDTTFHDGSNYGIPAASATNCSGLIDHLGSVGNNVTVGPSWARYLSYEDCAFSVRTLNGTKEAYVGPDDVSDLMKDSINFFGKSGSVRGSFKLLVSAEGVVPCNTEKKNIKLPPHERVEVEWIVASTSYNPPENPKPLRAVSTKPSA